MFDNFDDIKIGDCVIIERRNSAFVAQVTNVTAKFFDYGKTYTSRVRKSDGRVRGSGQGFYGYDHAQRYGYNALKALVYMRNRVRDNQLKSLMSDTSIAYMTQSEKRKLLSVLDEINKNYHERSMTQ